MLKSAADVKKCVRVSNPAIPKYRYGQLKFVGWGFKDTKIVYNGKSFEMIGSKHPPMNLVYAKKFLIEKLGVDFNRNREEEDLEIKPEDFPPAVINEGFVKDLRSAKIDITDDFNERLMRSICQSSYNNYLTEFIHSLKVADLVIFPESHNEVVKIVKSANLHDVILIPMGGTTNIIDSTNCPTNERR